MVISPKAVLKEVLSSLDESATMNGRLIATGTRLLDAKAVAVAG